MGKEGKYDLKLANPPTGSQDKDDIQLLINDCGKNTASAFLYSMYSIHIVSKTPVTVYKASADKFVKYDCLQEFTIFSAVFV